LISPPTDAPVPGILYTCSSNLVSYSPHAMNSKGINRQTLLYYRKQGYDEDNKPRAASTWPCSSSCGCWGHQVARCRSIVVFDRLPVLSGCSYCCRVLLRMLLFALPLDHDAVPDVQGVGPIHGIDLLVLTTVPRILPSVSDTVVDGAVLELLSLQTSSVNHDSPTSTYPPPET
jgi:hypothetical protein